MVRGEGGDRYFLSQNQTVFFKSHFFPKFSPKFGIFPEKMPPNFGRGDN